MDFKLLFRIHEKEKLLQISEQKSTPLVQDFLYENDYVLLVAKDKMGKSILALQLACCLSSGTPFLETLEVPKSVKVWYFATEGKDDDIKQRLIRMNKKIQMDRNNLKLICSSGLRLNSREGITGIKELIDKYEGELPKVIIIDPLYMAIRGSLKDDDVVNDFTYNVRKIAEYCDAAVIIVHHSRRPIRLHDGSMLNAGDDEIFGSAFLKASVDHIFYMGKVNHTSHKFLKCDTQRSGNIVETMELELREPSPLYFERVEPHEKGMTGIINNMRELFKEKIELTVKDICTILNISKPTVYVGLKRIDNLERIEGRPVIYKYKGGENET